MLLLTATANPWAAILGIVAVLYLLFHTNHATKKRPKNPKRYLPDSY